jgi:hypothetical protein
MFQRAALSWTKRPGLVRAVGSGAGLATRRALGRHGNQVSPQGCGGVPRWSPAGKPQDLQPPHARPGPHGNACLSDACSSPIDTLFRAPRAARQKHFVNAAGAKRRAAARPHLLPGAHRATSTRSSVRPGSAATSSHRARRDRYGTRRRRQRSFLSCGGRTHTWAGVGAKRRAGGPQGRRWECLFDRHSRAADPQAVEPSAPLEAALAARAGGQRAGPRSSDHVGAGRRVAGVVMRSDQVGAAGEVPCAPV